MRRQEREKKYYFINARLVPNLPPKTVASEARLAGHPSYSYRDCHREDFREISYFGFLQNLADVF